MMKRHRTKFQQRFRIILHTFQIPVGWEYDNSRLLRFGELEHQGIPHFYRTSIEFDPN